MLFFRAESAKSFPEVQLSRWPFAALLSLNCYKFYRRETFQDDFEEHSFSRLVAKAPVGGSHLLASSLSCHQSYPSLFSLNGWGRTVRPLSWQVAPAGRGRSWGAAWNAQWIGSNLSNGLTTQLGACLHGVELNVARGSWSHSPVCSDCCRWVPPCVLTLTVTKRLLVTATGAGPNGVCMRYCSHWRPRPGWRRVTDRFPNTWTNGTDPQRSYKDPKRNGHSV